MSRLLYDSCCMWAIICSWFTTGLNQPCPSLSFYLKLLLPLLISLVSYLRLALPLWFELTLLWTPFFPHQGSVTDSSFLHHRPFWGLFMKEESTPILWMNNDHTHKPDVEFDLSIFVLLRCKQNTYALFFFLNACDHLAGLLISDEA